MKPPQPFGHDAIHLQLRITVDCGDVAYRVAETARGGRGITWGGGKPYEKVVVDFWVVDLDGTPVVVDAWHNENAPSQQVDRIARTADSVTFATGG